MTSNKERTKKKIIIEARAKPEKCHICHTLEARMKHGKMQTKHG